MAKTGRKGKRKSFFASLAFIVAIIAVILGRFNKSFDSVNNAAVNTSNVPGVHFIDVGQGSSVLLQSGKTGVLIDAGEQEYGQTVARYLKSSGIEKLDYVIATHPHTDHIGGLAQVLKSFEVGSIIMPKLTAANAPTTKTYQNLLETVASKNIRALAAKPGNKYTAGKISFEILGPITQTNDLNNMSVVCKADVNSTSFLLLGDAEKPEIKSIMTRSPALGCDVILMGHHGSRSSLYNNFFAAASPNLAVISCGQGNSYGHPHEEVIEYLQHNNIEYYRTDKSGNIAVLCPDGGYSVKTQN